MSKSLQSVGTVTIDVPATGASHPYELHVVAAQDDDRMRTPYGVSFTVVVCFKGTGTGHEGHTYEHATAEQARTLVADWMPGMDATERWAAAWEVIAHLIELAMVARRFQ